MAWIRTIPRNDATGTLKEAYDWQAKRLGEPTEFTQLGSLYPDMVNHIAVRGGRSKTLLGFQHEAT